MIDCIITSPGERRVYKGLISVSLPALSGEMQILSGHGEAFALLKKGNIIIQKIRKQQEHVKILGGECYIKDDIVNIIL